MNPNRGAPDGPRGGSPRRLSRPSARRLASWLGLGTLAFLALVVLGGCWPYTLFPDYRFQKPAPFAGSRLFDPYAGATGRWWKANFHAHAYAWHGITNGHQSARRVRRFYRHLGYDIACVSNYQSIDDGAPGDEDVIPVYEHGYNVHKVHELVIGAKRVTWLDFPFDQSLSDRQYVLDRLDQDGGIVALAHPWLRNGYPKRALRYLTGYSLMEVARRGVVGADRWDAALSAGHLSWAIADDDEHDLNRPGDTGVSWTMVQAPTKDRSDVLAALRAGHTYGVVGRHGVSDVGLREVTLHHDTLVVRTDPGATSFRFIGQNGELRSEVRDSMEARYVVRPADTYVRVEIVTPHTRMLLNPVVRYDGTALVERTAKPVEPQEREDRALLAAGVIPVLGLLGFLGVPKGWGRLDRATDESDDLST